MKIRYLAPLAFLWLVAGCAHAQRVDSGSPRVAETDVVDIPQPPARAYHGLQLELRMPNPGKPVVTAVERGSPAAQAGFVAGDTITLFDGRDPVAARINFWQLTPGQAYQITVQRGGNSRVLRLVPAPPRRDG